MLENLIHQNKGIQSRVTTDVCVCVGVCAYLSILSFVPNVVLFFLLTFSTSPSSPTQLYLGILSYHCSHDSSFTINNWFIRQRAFIEI